MSNSSIYDRYSAPFDDVIEKYRSIISSIYNSYYVNGNHKDMEKSSLDLVKNNNNRFVLTLLYLYTRSNNNSSNVDNLVSNVEQFLEVNELDNIDYNSLISDNRFIEFVKDNYNINAMMFYPILTDKQLLYLNDIFNESLLEIVSR